MGVIKIMDKHAIIKLKKQGFSNRKAAEILKINRKTVARYWNEHIKNEKLINLPGTNIKALQEKICEEPKYNSDNRKPRKYSEEMDIRLNEILDTELEKCKELGINKQQLTNLQIHQLLLKENFEISYTTISNKIKVKRNKSKECFIRQSYDLGVRLEPMSILWTQKVELFLSA